MHGLGWGWTPYSWPGYQSTSAWDSAQAGGRGRLCNRLQAGVGHGAPLARKFYGCLFSCRTPL